MDSALCRFLKDFSTSGGYKKWLKVKKLELVNPLSEYSGALLIGNVWDQRVFRLVICLDLMKRIILCSNEAL